MKRCVIVFCAFALSGGGIASANVELRLSELTGVAAAGAPENEAMALNAAQDRALLNYERNMSLLAAALKRKQTEVAAAEEQTVKTRAKAAAAATRAAKRARKNAVGSPTEQAARQAKREAEALAAVMDRVVAYYKRSIGAGTDRAVAKAPRGIEKLACFTGIQDRHARIGVQLVNGKVDFFAYYSKLKPRTCSIAIDRNGSGARWEDYGATSKVTLREGKGVLLISRKSGSYRFVFRGVDRMRYCGMDGKINGSLTVTRGKSTCVVQGVMDGHEG